MSQVCSEVIKDTDLDEWSLIGSGGFGRVCKVRHKKWRLDLAVKLLHNTSSPAEIKALNTEANHMKSLFFEFVVRLYGIYDGTPPSEKSRQRGLVMEYMRRGSIETLQKEMAGPPPLPLAFRLAHQVALGMNFLHSKKVLHCDLKPSNVLLTGELNAKLADFGLSRVSTSALSKHIPTEEVGGTYKYMPPEAFDPSYEPVRSFDIYSFGILLWSIFTGQEPYKGKPCDLVEMLIRKGGRPKFELCQKQEEGMEEIVLLMTRCWDENPKNRPKSEDITKDTEGLFLKHQSKVTAAVHEVLLKLDSQGENSQSNEAAGASPCTPVSENALLNDVVDNPGVFTQPVKGFGGASAFPGCQSMGNVINSEQMSGPLQVQHGETPAQPCMDTHTPMTSGRVCLTKKEKAKFVDDKRPVITQRASQVMAIVEELGKKVHPESYSDIRAERTSQGQMRVLYIGPLRSGGDSVKAAFYDALKAHEPDLMEDLGG